MRLHIALSLILCLGSSALFSGCATVVSGRDATVSVKSNPPQAYVAIKNQEGKVVAEGMTPMKVNLDRSRGLLKKPPQYTATLKKPGYRPQKIAIRPKVNPWLVGNLMLGGPIGVVADSATGAMWNLKPNKIEQQLIPLSPPAYSDARNSEVHQATFVSDE